MRSFASRRAASPAATTSSTRAPRPTPRTISSTRSFPGTSPSASSRRLAPTRANAGTSGRATASPCARAMAAAAARRASATTSAPPKRGGTYGYTDVGKPPYLWGGYADHIPLSVFADQEDGPADPRRRCGDVHTPRRARRVEHSLAWPEKSPRIPGDSLVAARGGSRASASGKRTTRNTRADWGGPTAEGLGLYRSGNDGGHKAKIALTAREVHALHADRDDPVVNARQRQREHVEQIGLAVADEHGLCAI